MIPFEQTFDVFYGPETWLDLLGFHIMTVDHYFRLMPRGTSLKWFLRTLFFWRHYPTGKEASYSLRKLKKRLDPDYFEKKVKEMSFMIFEATPRVRTPFLRSSF